MKINFPKCVFSKFRLADYYLAGPDVSTGLGLAGECFVRNKYDHDTKWYFWLVENDKQQCGTILQNNGTHVTYLNAVQKSSDYGSNAVINRGFGTLRTV